MFLKSIFIYLFSSIETFFNKNISYRSFFFTNAILVGIFTVNRYVGRARKEFYQCINYFCNKNDINNTKNDKTRLL